MRSTWDNALDDPDSSFWERLGYEEMGTLRQQMLVATVRMANEVGPGSFSAKALAEQLQIAPATVNYHFASREALLAEAAFVGYALYVERVWQAVEAAPKNPKARLRAWIETAITIQVAMRGWGPVLNYPTTSLGITAVIDEQFRERMTQYSQLHLARLVVLTGDVRRDKMSDVKFSLGNVPLHVVLRNASVVASAASIGWSVLGLAVWSAGHHLPSGDIPERSVFETQAIKHHVDRLIREAETRK